MNVYDFDGTVYRGDSTIDFYLFVLKNNLEIIKYLPIQIKGFFCYYLKTISKEKQKELFFTFIKEIEMKDYVDEFWKTHKSKIKKWYLSQKHNSDIIISASPEFLLKPICKELGVELIATIVNADNGKIIGHNCKGAEKVNRFKSVYGDSIIEKFYSDSKSDYPMALLAKESFFVKKEEIKRWRIQ